MIERDCPNIKCKSPAMIEKAGFFWHQNFDGRCFVTNVPTPEQTLIIDRAYLKKPQKVVVGRSR